MSTISTPQHVEQGFGEQELISWSSRFVVPWQPAYLSTSGSFHFGVNTVATSGQILDRLI